MPKAIIIGATSGIGEALAKKMAQEGYELGLTGRRVEKLAVLQKALSTSVHIQKMDVTLFDEARQQLLDLIQKMDGVDVVVVNAGIGWVTTKWENEQAIINTNVTGFVAIANAAFHYFKTQPKGKGHIVGISSVAAVRGGGQIPSYHASKAFISSYMEGLRYKALKKGWDIAITDIRPGFVETPMTEQNDVMFWVATVDKAAQQILNATKRKSKTAYITKRWRLAAWLMRILPDAVYSKM